MRLFPREAWSYAVLLVILFCIAALAVWQSISYIEDVIEPRYARSVTTLVWSLTMGFMLIAGAFGLWATRFASEAESRRRIGRFVDAMDYLQDGLMALDRRGYVSGFNPTAAALLDGEVRYGRALADCFTCLNADDIAGILSTSEPYEVEHDHPTPSGTRSLRFRSQPSEDMVLLLVSDVTVAKALRLRNRQVAHLQLIGQLARGVAHDFNRLLCCISGHAGLLHRLTGHTPDTRLSCDAIAEAAERGIELAAHLLELSRPDTAVPSSTSLVSDHILAAAETLRDSLPNERTVHTMLHDHLPAAGVTGLQLEQIIVNLGFVAAESAAAQRHLHILAAAPEPGTCFDVSPEYAGVLVIRVSDTDRTDTAPLTNPLPDTDFTGVIVSVLSSLLDEAHGQLQVFSDSDGRSVFRVLLPYAPVSAVSVAETDELSEEIAVYLRDWTVLLAAPGQRYRAFGERLAALGVHVERVDNLAGALARVEDARRLDAIVLHSGMLRNVAAGLLRAILKLRPHAALAVVSEHTHNADWQMLAAQLTTVPEHASTGQMILALIEAKGQAVRRGHSDVPVVTPKRSA